MVALEVALAGSEALADDDGIADGPLRVQVFADVDPAGGVTQNGWKIAFPEGLVSGWDSGGGAFSEFQKTDERDRRFANSESISRIYTSGDSIGISFEIGGFEIGTSIDSV